MSQFLPSIQMKRQMYGRMLSTGTLAKPEFVERQDGLYKFFFSRLMGGKNPVLEALNRTGPIRWQAPKTSAKEEKADIQAWKKTSLEAGNLIMNCWNAVIYSAFQAGTMSLSDCVSKSIPLHAYKKRSASALKSALGNARSQPLMGDLAVWHSNKIVHVAIYLGRAPFAGSLKANVRHHNSSVFIWQNSGLSSWALPPVGFTHIAPLSAVDANTARTYKAKLEFFRPSWWM